MRRGLTSTGLSRIRRRRAPSGSQSPCAAPATPKPRSPTRRDSGAHQSLHQCLGARRGWIWAARNRGFSYPSRSLDDRASHIATTARPPVAPHPPATPPTATTSRNRLGPPTPPGPPLPPTAGRPIPTAAPARAAPAADAACSPRAPRHRDQPGSGKALSGVARELTEGRTSVVCSRPHSPWWSAHLRGRETAFEQRVMACQRGPPSHDGSTAASSVHRSPQRITNRSPHRAWFVDSQWALTTYFVVGRLGLGPSALGSKGPTTRTTHYSCICLGHHPAITAKPCCPETTVNWR